MGSIRVVVVFSSRFSFFSGGPEPPSPAARLLLRPDIAAVAEGQQLGALRAVRSGEAALPSPAANRGQSCGRARSSRAPGVPLDTSAGPRPRRLRGPHPREGQPSATILDFTGRHRPPDAQRRRQGSSGCGETYFLFLLVALGSASRVYEVWFCFFSAID